jgi:Putative zinc-finger
MKALTCAATRRRLEAFLDRELPVPDQIAVSAHLDWCDECAALTGELRSVGAALRTIASGRTALSADESASFGTLVVSRFNAERAVSFDARVRGIFEDLRFVYVGLSATVAATVCLLVMVGMMRFATNHRPDSLAAILNVMAMPLECESIRQVPDVLACRARWVQRFQRANETAEQDAVFTLDAIVIHDGRLANLAVLRASRRDATGQAEVVEELLDTVSRARSATLQGGELPAPLLRVVARETVRASRQAPNDLQLPSPTPTPVKVASRRVIA